jgi:hypothetical protein
LAQAAGASGFGVLGVVFGPDSWAVYGDNVGGGNAGYFATRSASINNESPSTPENATLVAQNLAGSLATPGYYGNAGYFENVHPMNIADVIFAATHSDGVAAAIHGLVGPASKMNTHAAVFAEDAATKPDAAGIVASSEHNIAGLFGVGNGGFCLYKGGPGWDCTAGRSAVRQNPIPANPGLMLRRLMSLPLEYYQTGKGDGDLWYFGPAPEAFAAAFALGGRPDVINSGSIEGIALAAIQGLDRELEAALKARDAEIASLEQQLAEQKRAHAEMGARLSALERQVAGQPVTVGRLAAARY